MLKIKLNQLDINIIDSHFFIPKTDKCKAPSCMLILFLQISSIHTLLFIKNEKEVKLNIILILLKKIDVLSYNL